MRKLEQLDLPMVVPVNRRRLSRREQRAVYRVLSIALGFDRERLSGAELMILTDARAKIKPLRRKSRRKLKVEGETLKAGDH